VSSIGFSSDEEVILCVLGMCLEESLPEIGNIKTRILFIGMAKSTNA